MSELHRLKTLPIDKGRRCGRRGTLKCHRCRLQKRGKRAPCETLPGSPEGPCVPCIKSNRAKECGRRTYPNGDTERDKEIQTLNRFNILDSVPNLTINQQEQGMLDQLIIAEYSVNQPATTYPGAAQQTTMTFDPVDLNSADADVALKVKQVLLSARFVHSDPADIEKVVKDVRKMERKEEEKTLESLLGTSMYKSPEAPIPEFPNLGALDWGLKELQDMDRQWY